MPDANEVKEIEPNLNVDVKMALHSENTAIISPSFGTFVFNKSLLVVVISNVIVGINPTHAISILSISFYEK